MPAVKQHPDDYDDRSSGIDDEVRFIRSEDCCVCFVDIVNSTGTTSKINDSEKVRLYYGIFLNTMSAIARNFGAEIIKNVGDSLMFWFPDILSEKSFREVIECCITMIEARDQLNEKLHEEDLPIVSYRISADYGRVEVAIEKRSNTIDLFGPTVNRCSKINSLAPPNGLVIGKDLYELIQSIPLRPSLETYFLFEKMDSSEGHHVFLLRRNVLPSERLTNKMYRKRTRTILLVDDEEDILYTFKTGLISQGFNVEAFGDPLEALAHFATVAPSHYDLAILDIRMPGLNGLQLYYRLKAINRNIKILFVSALDAVPELLSILPDVKKTKDIIKKPSTIDNFLNVVNAALI
jgi:CheY-like chemotaxis protein